MAKQAAVLLRAASLTSSTDVEQIFLDIPSPSAPRKVEEFLPGEEAVASVELPLTAQSDETDKIIILHAKNNADKENRLANEILLDETGESRQIHGDAILLYAQHSRDFLMKPDWEALHDVCYGARLAGLGKGVGKEDMAKLVTEFHTRLGAASTEHAMDMAVDGEGDDNEWSDEDIEKPREPKKDSDDDDEGSQKQESGSGRSEDEDSNASFEDDESELESDGNDDPRKKALLETIKDLITKDGKIDLERLGLIEKNGKLVSKDS
ncbi:MAG: hypothetical protein CYPHOPRED_000499 [Cyphobasidiales sp. Tagirdzhanova-0007]|nr:MAG: hypothetical protein CYPHOPRED_000499 [Cyphobasidiales sp. Tagirdzhanova-0007]